MAADRGVSAPGAGRASSSFSAVTVVGSRRLTLDCSIEPAATQAALQQHKSSRGSIRADRTIQLRMQNTSWRPLHSSCGVFGPRSELWEGVTRECCRATRATVACSLGIKAHVYLCRMNEKFALGYTQFEGQEGGHKSEIRLGHSKFTY